MTPRQLQEIANRQENNTDYWDISIAQQDRQELLDHIAELEAQCKGKVCLDREAVEARRQNRPIHLDLFPVQQLPDRTRLFYDKDPDVAAAVVGEGEE